MNNNDNKYPTITVIRHEEANRTALEAIGGPKKRKFGDNEGSSSNSMGPPPLPVTIVKQKSKSSPKSSPKS